MIGVQVERAMVRGDTFYLPIRYIINGVPYVFTENDIVIFRLWDAYSKVTLIQKRCTDYIDGAIRIKLDPEDTEGLSFKKYKYEVEWTNPAGDIFTLIYDSTMDIHPEGERVVT